jgi:hypothetical protein
MHIVLVHYLEVKVIANSTLVDMYIATCLLYFQTIGFHHPKCCILEIFCVKCIFFLRYIRLMSIICCYSNHMGFFIAYP